MGRGGAVFGLVGTNTGAVGGNVAGGFGMASPSSSSACWQISHMGLEIIWYGLLHVLHSRLTTCLNRANFGGLGIFTGFLVVVVGGNVGKEIIAGLEGADGPLVLLGACIPVTGVGLGVGLGVFLA